MGKKLIAEINKVEGKFDSMGNKVDRRKSYGFCSSHGKMTEAKKFSGVLRCVHCGKEIK